MNRCDGSRRISVIHGEQRSRPMNFDPDIVRREISMMYPYDPEYPWPGYSPEVMDGSLSWRMPDDLVVMEWLFDVITISRWTATRAHSYRSIDRRDSPYRRAMNFSVVSRVRSWGLAPKSW